MGVKVKQFGGGARPVTAFSDDFNRAGSTQGFGANWLYGGFQVQSLAFANLGPVGIDTQQATWQATGVLANTQVPINWYAVPVMSALNGRSQFVQFTFKSNNAVLGSRQLFIGAGVLGGYVDTGAGSDFREYLLWTVSGGGFANDEIHISRFDNGAFTELVNVAGVNIVTAPADSVFRLNATVVSASVTVEAFKNGVSIGSLVDNTASRATSGSQFMGRRMWVSGAAPGTGDARIDNFVCGKL